MLRTILLIPVLVGTLAFTASAQVTPEADLQAAPGADPQAIPETDQADLAGVYICDGVNPSGRPYQGIVEIVKDHDVYQVVWSFESEVVAIGLGIRSGEVLAVMHYSGIPGVVAYRIERGPRLVGEWTFPGADGALFSETLTKAPDEIGAPARPGPGTPERREQRQREPRPRGVIVARSRM
jgi:hypothetical protein